MTTEMTPNDIKVLRKKLKLTQTAFGYLLSVSFVTVNRWEQGKFKPNRSSIERMNTLRSSNGLPKIIPVREEQMVEPGRIRIKTGWDKGGREGTLLGGPIHDLKGQDWMVVQWDGDDDPDLHKAAGLDIAVIEWRAVTKQ
jgi:putative transcriptional regulator